VLIPFAPDEFDILLDLVLKLDKFAGCHVVGACQRDERIDPELCPLLGLADMYMTWLQRRALIREEKEFVSVPFENLGHNGKIHTASRNEIIGWARIGV
jgi:hypothetical protein